MAAKRERPAPGFYNILNLCPAVKSKKQPTRKPCMEGDFFIERIIRSREQRTGKEYLIKWSGYSRAECTWEPKENIPGHLIRCLYDNPQPSSKRVDEVAVKFISTIKGKLRSKSNDPIFTIDMDHDIFRYLFSGMGQPSNISGAVLLEKNDFERMPLLTESWWYCLNRNGEGSEVDFPLRAKPILRKSTSHYVLDQNHALIQVPSFTQEIVSFYLTRNPCSVDSLRVD